MTRVVIVDNNAIVLRGIAAVLTAADPGMQIVGEGANGREAIALAREHQPDVILLDVEMPIMDGVQAAETLAAEFRVLMLSYADDEHRVTAAIRAGACGYLVHGRFEPEELADSVRRAAHGETIISPAVASTVFAALRRGPEGDTMGDPLELTAREREVMSLVAEGLSNRDIAQRLVVTEKTVKNHVHNTYRKLGVTRRGQAIAHWLGSSRDGRGA
jgi:DNA-binding NarL/FixJ family response regulator